MFIPLALAVGFSMVTSYLTVEHTGADPGHLFLRGHANRRTVPFREGFRNVTPAPKTSVGLRWLIVVIYVVVTGLVIAFLASASAKKSFPAWTPDSFNCGFALRPAHEWRPPKRSRSRPLR